MAARNWPGARTGTPGRPTYRQDERQSTAARIWRKRAQCELEIVSARRYIRARPTSAKAE